MHDLRSRLLHLLMNILQNSHGLLQYLHDHNWEGYVSSEYEGNRFTPAGTPMQEKKQVAMQQAYLRKCLQEIQG